MAAKKVNIRLIIIILVTVFVLSITAYGFRNYNRDRRAEVSRRSGMRLYEKRLWEQAATNLGEYIAIVPDDSDVLFKYARAQLARRPLKGQFINQAINAYRQILRIDESHPDAAKELIGIYLNVIDDPLEAQQIAQNYLGVSSDMTIQRLHAVALAKQRNFHKAAEELKEIISQNPDQVLAYQALARLIEERPKDYADTPEYFLDLAVMQNSDQAIAYIIRADYYQRTNDSAAAIKDLIAAVECDLTDYDTRLRLTVSLTNLRQTEQASQQLEILQTIDPQNLQLWNTWAVLALSTASKEQMYYVAETGLDSLAPDVFDFLPVAAQLYIKSAHPESAQSVIDQMNTSNADPAIVAYLDGLLATRQAKWHDAVKSLQNAIKLGYDSREANLIYADALTRIGDLQSATLHLRKTISSNPNEFAARTMLAELLMSTGNYSQAQQQFRKVLELDPQNEHVRLMEIQSRINLLSLNRAKKDPSEWIEILNELKVMATQMPELSSIALTTVNAAILVGQLDHAENILSQNAQLFSDDQRFYIIRADLHIARDQQQKAIEVLQAAITRFPASPKPVAYLSALQVSADQLENARDTLLDGLSRMETIRAKRRLSVMLADVYMRQGHPSDAVELLKQQNDEIGDDIILTRRLIDIHLQNGELKLAGKYLDQLKTIVGGDSWQFKYEQARLYFDSDTFEKDYTRITALLEENLEHDPDDQASRLLLAASHEKANNFQLSARIYSQALDRDPDNTDIAARTVAALYRTNSYDQADEILRNAPAVQDDLRLSRMQLKRYLAEGKLEPAVGVLDKLLEENPKDFQIRLAAALLKIQQHQYDKAMKMLKDMEAENQSSLPVKAALVDLHVRMQLKEDALEICDRAVKELSTADAYLLRASTLAFLQQNLAALNDIDTALSISPDDPDNLVRAAMLYRKMQKKDLAAGAISKALDITPDDLTIQRQAAIIFVADDRVAFRDRGTKLLHDVLEQNPDDIELLLMKSWNLLEQNTTVAFNSAVEILTKIIDSHPKVSRAWNMLARIRLKQARTDEAIKLVNMGLTHSPKNRSLLLTKARIYAPESKDIAINTLETLRKTYPNDMEAALYLVYIFVDSQQYDRALSILNEISINAADADLRKIKIAFAITLHESGYSQQAQQIFYSLYHQNPDDPAIMIAQVRILKKNQNYYQIVHVVADWLQNYPQDTSLVTEIAKELARSNSHASKEAAEKIFNVVVNTDYDSVDAIFSLALLYHASGRVNKAVQFYERVLMLDSSKLSALNNMAWILCEDLNEYEQALELASKGLQIDPEYADLIDTAAVAKYRLARYYDAIEDFNRCIRLYQPDTVGIANAYFHLARAYYKLQRKSEAKLYLNRALQINEKINALSPQDINEAKAILAKL